MSKYYCDKFDKKIIKLKPGENSPSGEEIYDSWKECYESEASKPDYDNTYFRQWENKKFK